MKFMFDRVMSFIGLAILCWVYLIIMILIKIQMPDGPVFFTQERIGRQGKRFKIHKFRTMYVDQEGPSVAYPMEGRITPLGAKLRRLKLDELPELWDVFIGNMSFVGPRPDVPGYADCLEGEDRVILELRPGITGPATLKYRNEEKLIIDYVEKAKAEGDPRQEQEIAVWFNDNVIYPDKVRINKYYAQHATFWLDMKMIFCTLLGKDYDCPMTISCS
ncbi:MAG: sugar transferase [Bacteroidales bacterium]|nr:sugar transferase [Bacteroidales bacterium]